MIFHILTLFPAAFSGYLQSSILGKAAERGQVRVDLVDFRQYATDRHKTCDDAPYGGGPGMLLKPEPLFMALDDLGASTRRVVFPSPSGRLFSQEYAARLACQRELVMICGHYEGVDQRVVDAFVTDEISIGDYVVFSGEVAAMVVLEAVVRLLPGVIREESTREESFSQGLLEYPQYTRPEEYRGIKVPEVLTSGHHARIIEWRLRESLKKTRMNRPDLLERSEIRDIT